jgi:CheY-like chemotaxis protein
LPHILVIDDVKLVLRTIEAVLLRAGHCVEVAENGREGIRKFVEGEFDLVITDIIMPDMEGIETIREIRRSGRAVKVVAMSGGARTRSLDYLNAARQLGADGILEKPFSPDELLGVVARMTSAPVAAPPPPHPALSPISAAD